KEVFQSFYLTAVLALPYGVGVGCLDDTPGGAHFQQCPQAVQRQAAFSKDPVKHDYLVLYSTITQLSRLYGGRRIDAYERATIRKSDQNCAGHSCRTTRGSGIATNP